MRRSIARGRVFPQSYSTDRRYGRLSLKACALFPLMWANADDQGRLPGEPEEIKYACCPNIDHITKADIPELLEELDKNQLIKVYTTSKTEAIQILDWWDIHRPQWAWPSDYPPPDGWKDRLRYKRGAKEVVKENWFSQVSENNASGEQHTATQVSENSASGEQHTVTQVSDKMGSGETTEIPPLRTSYEKETEKERGKRKPKEEIHLRAKTLSGEKSTPSPRAPPSEIEILHRLTECFKREWGRVPAESPEKVILREPTAKESAQLRDLAKELSSPGGCPLETIDEAFREVAGQPQPKMHVSYVRKVLRAWLGLERGPP